MTWSSQDDLILCQPSTSRWIVRFGSIMVMGAFYMFCHLFVAVLLLTGHGTEMAPWI